MFGTRPTALCRRPDGRCVRTELSVGRRNARLSARHPAPATEGVDRIVGDDTEWRDLWEDAGSYADAVGALQTIRVALKLAVRYSLSSPCLRESPAADVHDQADGEEADGDEADQGDDAHQRQHKRRADGVPHDS